MGKYNKEDDEVRVGDITITRVKVFSFREFSYNAFNDEAVEGSPRMYWSNEESRARIKPLYSCTAQSRVSGNGHERFDVSLDHVIFDEQCAEAMSISTLTHVGNGYGWRSEKEAIDFSFSISYDKMGAFKRSWEEYFGEGTVKTSEIELETIQEKFNERKTILEDLTNAINEAGADIEKLREIKEKFSQFRFSPYPFKGRAERYAQQVGAKSEDAIALVEPYEAINEAITKRIDANNEILTKLLQKEAVNSLVSSVPVVKIPEVGLTDTEKTIKNLNDTVKLLVEFVRDVSAKYKMAEKAVELVKGSYKYEKIRELI